MKKHLIATILLIVYCAILFKVMVLKDLPVIRIGHLRLKFGGAHEGNANLIPFKTIIPYLLGKGGFIISGLNIIGNIFLLVPIGFLVPISFQRINWTNALILAFATGFSIELLQVVLQVGIFDIDDVILNGIGVLLGYWLFVFSRNSAESIIKSKINAEQQVKN